MHCVCTAVMSEASSQNSSFIGDLQCKCIGFFCQMLFFFQYFRFQRAPLTILQHLKCVFKEKSYICGAKTQSSFVRGRCMNILQRICEVSSLNSPPRVFLSRLIFKDKSNSHTLTGENILTTCLGSPKIS